MMLMGLLGLMMTPRQEDPQISVPMVDIFVQYTGASAEQVSNLAIEPLERIMSEIDGVKHVYSAAQRGMGIVTIEFDVGEQMGPSLVKVNDKLDSNMDRIPPGVSPPLVKAKGIDDVPVVNVTLWSKDLDGDGMPDVDDGQLRMLAHDVLQSIKELPDTGNSFVVGGRAEQVTIEVSPERLSGYGISLDQVAQRIQTSNSEQQAGGVESGDTKFTVMTGSFLKTTDDISRLVIGTHNDVPVYVHDVARVVQGPEDANQLVAYYTGPAGDHEQPASGVPAVTIAVAKKPGVNGVTVASAIVDRVEQLKGIRIPSNVEVSITRNYGETAEDKVNELIFKLFVATGFVFLLVLFAFRALRPAIVVVLVIPVVLLMTIFYAWVTGYTIDRVSLFALIFSIGILVDDAIVVVENIHRHLAMGSRNLIQAIPAAVDEVGGPTILATFTVIAALLPMAFVTGLMGPYMSPIPINASLGMLISLAVAFIFTPWLTHLALGRVDHEHTGDESTGNGLLQRLFNRVMTPFLAGSRGRAMRWLLLLSVLLLIAGSIFLVVNRSVVLKMLPFDNKSEFQVVLDMPEGTSLEQTARVLNHMGRYLGSVSEVTDYQVYAGTSAPISFNGLVRQYYLRSGANMGDIQVNLVDKSKRDRKSHDIALAVRPALQEIAGQYQGNAKVVELPPGPPVLSPLVGEVYGIDYDGQIEQARALRGLFESTPDIIDVDDSVEYPSEKILLQVDRLKAAQLGIDQAEITRTLGMILGGEDVTHLHGENLKYAVPIRVEYHPGDKTDMNQLLTLGLPTVDGRQIPLSEVVTLQSSRRAHAIHHKDLLPVVYVTGDMAGETDSPLYGLFAISGRIDQQADGLEQWFLSQPENPYEYSVKWDGEWQVTYETFRDMGIAYSVGLLLIYLLVVAQFRSYLVPLVIMAPIPLTLIGILPGHALLDRQFTATSMIGMIALAGIIVRNSILLVDFINQQVREGMALGEAVVLSAVVRAKPIVLTALAAMAGAFFILDDPIFSGLAVSLIFGLLVSTLLTLVVIPVVYYAAMENRIEKITSTAD